MKKQWWVRVVDSVVLVSGYVWYNGNLHSMLARVLS
jgi:hypothetical protein